MKNYQSTRNKQIQAAASLAILNGLAEDGGLYMIRDFSDCQIDLADCLSCNYQELAEKIFSCFLTDFTADEIHDCVSRAYTHKFDTEEITPVVQVGSDWILELFHGPTSAFKDVALSILPHFMVTALKKQQIQNEVIILTATSGDTGKAAMEGFKDVAGCQIFVFYPHQGVSAVQKQQMATQEGKNVHVLAVKGNFDDCQTGVKKIFMREHQQHFSSANSINIGRLVPQIVYYFKAYLDLVNKGAIHLHDQVNFVVPTGNFGNILAGYLAKQMGLPVGKLVCASNENNVLTDFIQTGIYNKNRTFKKTISPSMDILVSSNLERLLYLMSEDDDEQIREYMSELNSKGFYEVHEGMKKRLAREFYAGYATSTETQQMIQKVYQDYHYLMDTHTAVAYKVFEDFKKAKLNDDPTVILSTASPYKFTKAVLDSLETNDETNEFACMKQLQALTQTHIPSNLIDIEQKNILHQQVIAIDEMEEAVLRELVNV